LNKVGIDSFGVDVSIYAISEAPEPIKDQLRVLDIEEDTFPFPERHFDIITILEVVEHLNCFEHLIKETGRILNKSGYVLITTPTPGGRGAKVDKTHVNVQPRRFWVELFNKHGFILVRDNTWINFKAAFLKEFKNIMPVNPPSTKISATLMKMGKIGNYIRTNSIPFIDYFSFLRSNEILLFRKADESYKKH